MNRLVTGILMVLLIGGCVSSEPKRLDAAFGSSVANMIEAQTLNPHAADVGPSPVMGMDGQKAEGNLEAYRQDVQKKTEVRDVINVGITK